MAQTTSIAALKMDLWSGDTTELTRRVTAGRIPPIPKVILDLQVTTSNSDGILAYMVLQMIKSTDKQVVLRALASATAHILNDRTNMTGSPLPPITLDGLAKIVDDDISPETVITTNFEDAEDVTKSEILALAEADVDELGAFFGLMFIAGNKRITADNRAAFNEKRQSAATAGVIGDPLIFFDNSPYLEDALMQKMNAVFTSLGDIRSNLTANVVKHLPNCRMGAAQAFANMFNLLADFGMGGLRSIRIVLGKYAWVRAAFPELHPEMKAANAAFQLLLTAPADLRPFVKAIHGNQFIPVGFSQIENLVGVCKKVESYTNATFANYRGGKITEQQEAIVVARMEATTIRTPNEDASTD